MKELGTCRPDERKAVAAEIQTAPCIVPSLPAGSCHTAIKENASSASGRNDPSESIADGGDSNTHSDQPQVTGQRVGFELFHSVRVAKAPRTPFHSSKQPVHTQPKEEEQTDRKTTK